MVPSVLKYFLTQLSSANSTSSFLYFFLLAWDFWRLIQLEKSDVKKKFNVSAFSMPPSPAPQHYSAVGLHFPYSSFCYLNAYTSSSFALDLLCQIQSQVNFDFPNCVFACLDHVSQVAVPAFPNLYTSFSPVKVARSLFFIHTGLLEFLEFLHFGMDNS